VIDGVLETAFPLIVCLRLTCLQYLHGRDMTVVEVDAAAAADDDDDERTVVPDDYDNDRDDDLD
jgi:hypothetical protein